MKPPPGSNARSAGGIRHARKHGRTVHVRPSSPKADRRRFEAERLNALMAGTWAHWRAR